MSQDNETLAYYGRAAGDYAERTAHLDEDPALEAFIAALPKGARVLDLGCGPGVMAARMAAEGFAVLATDAVPEMVKMAGAHPGVEARVARFDDIDGEAEFDGVWANFSLLHAPRGDLPGHLAAIHRALRPGGLFHIGMKLGDGEKRDELGRLYTFVTEDELRGLLHDTGFGVVETTQGREAGMTGVPEDWITILAKAV
ncbi:bifunctional 2-polyprenyl-6-hydroxyphenol methylase/3-demethylubiquinol 3-O-methyltransferase UbiG [Roseovarius sp. MMSF_3281]|uniref:class I SAM-dependent methyltransferase n=1 Tax=Roseovarius sp. MMSF_3281 TaxID=3046694 RepID=UPI00273FC833|nr:class I SAM-dependent methyltransferase [Roseovarius sp. MMSF_3281]